MLYKELEIKEHSYIHKGLRPRSMDVTLSIFLEDTDGRTYNEHYYPGFQCQCLLGIELYSNHSSRDDKGYCIENIKLTDAQFIFQQMFIEKAFEDGYIDP